MMVLGWNFTKQHGGVIHGKFIAYQDDTRIEVESHLGVWHGIQRKFKDRRMESEEIYNNGRKM